MDGPVTPERIMQLAWGYTPPLIIDAAVRAGVFDQLSAGPATLDDLATKTGASRRGLKAVLNALVGLRLLAWGDGRYRLTPESEVYLVSGSPEYRGSFFRHHIDQLLPQWLELRHSLRTGRPAARTDREAHGAEYFATFVESLFPGGRPAAMALGKHLALAKAAAPVSVLDLGAGSGVWGICLAQQSRWVRIRAVDWPAVLEVTRRVAERHGVVDRLTVVPGDVLEADFGKGHQVAVLGHILHSEGPERIGRLLGRTFEALAPGGVVAIQEFMPDDDRAGPLLPLLFAVNMLVNTESGDTYTFAELAAWLRQAGFEDPRRFEVPAVSPLVLANKPVSH